MRRGGLPSAGFGDQGRDLQLPVRSKVSCNARVTAQSEASCLRAPIMLALTSVRVCTGRIARKRLFMSSAKRRQCFDRGLL